MADGKTHDAWGIATAIASSVIASSWLPEGAITTAYVLGSIAGFTHLSPDIDLPQSRPSQRWLILNYAWHPLRSKTHHRGITHTPFIGSAVVMGYALVMLGGIWSFTSPDMFAALESPAFWAGLFVFYCGVTIQQLLHLLLDGILIERLLGR